MKLMNMLLLSTAAVVGIAGTSVAVGFGSKPSTRDSKEPPSTVLAVQVETPKTQKTEKIKTKAKTAKPKKVKQKPVTLVPNAGFGFTQAYNIPMDPVKRCPQWEATFRKYGLPDEIFSYIAWKESRCNPLSVSRPNSDGSTDHGLVQINSSWKTVVSEVCRAPRGDLSVLTNVDCNLSVAKWLIINTKGKLGNWSIYLD
jgi:hypothetical protein